MCPAQNSGKQWYSQACSSAVSRLLYSPDTTFGHSMSVQPAESTAVIKFDYLWKWLLVSDFSHMALDVSQCAACEARKWL